MKLSVIIPSWKDPLLHKTIDSILQNSELGDDLEIIVVFDGYIPEKPVVSDKRVKTLLLGKNRGMRGAINAGVLISKGEFIMRTDEHCMYSKGFDKIMIEAIKDNEIHTLRRYFLDPVKWEVMDKEPVDSCRLLLDKSYPKFSGFTWKEHQEKMRDIMIYETQAMQGSQWCMKRSWWDKVIKELQSEGYGTHYQDSIEMVFKTWQSGGKLMVNKNAWYAHKHREFPRTHNINRDESQASFNYAIKIWGDYYNEIIKTKCLI